MNSLPAQTNVGHLRFLMSKFKIQIKVKFSRAKSINISLFKSKKFPDTTQILHLEYVFLKFAAPNYMQFCRKMSDMCRNPEVTGNISTIPIQPKDINQAWAKLVINQHR